MTHAPCTWSRYTGHWDCCHAYQTLDAGDCTCYGDHKEGNPELMTEPRHPMPAHHPACPARQGGECICRASDGWTLTLGAYVSIVLVAVAVAALAWWGLYG